jgi:hypothetical protein
MISVPTVNTLHATTYTLDDGPCETETYHVAVEGCEIRGVAEPEAACVCVYTLTE